ncbi:hypothetical protein HK103_006711 [Boothiomyces macroporosus]|uniref:VWFD domain-containing protein n=1 Tax=Boothiomyces macroporosus TaxID=261099 RepID=A0AAD5Y6W6_9FUNG|nr:hypothetical protein HK103_006711 [Boothiomyces macroporosus]
MFALLFQLVAATALLEFDPPILNLQDTVLGSSFRTRMLKKPTSNVKVYFEAPGLTFSDCFVDISVDTFDQWKQITVAGVSVFEQRNAAGFNITARAFVDQTFVDHELVCNRIVAPAGTCTSIGDPHFTTLNGLTYSQFGNGVFHLAQHEHLSIQAAQGFCFGNTVTCNQAIAIRYGSSIIALDTRVAGNIFNMAEITKNVDGIAYQNPNTANAAHTVTLPCGSVIQLIVNNDNKGNKWIDFTLHLAAGYDSIGGLCNRPSGNAQGLILRDGTSVAVTAFDQFANSWKVTDDENLFMGKYKPSVPAIVGVHAACTLPQVVVEVVVEKPIIVLPPYVPPVLPATTTKVPSITTTAVYTTTTTTTLSQTTTDAPKATTTVGNSANLITTTSIPPAATATDLPKAITTVLTLTTSNVITPAPQPTVAPPADYLKDIKEHCQKIFTIPGCSELVNADSYIQSCIKDAIAAGSMVFAEPARMIFMSHCKQTSNYMVKDYDDKAVQKAQAIQQQTGLNQHNCPANCNGNGVCGDNGCRCKPTFGGIDCSIDMTKAKCMENDQVLNQTPASTYVAPPSLPKQVTPPANYVKVYGQDASIMYSQSVPQHPFVQPSSTSSDLPKADQPTNSNPIANQPTDSSPTTNQPVDSNATANQPTASKPSSSDYPAAPYAQVSTPAGESSPILSSAMYSGASLLVLSAIRALLFIVQSISYLMGIDIQQDLQKLQADKAALANNAGFQKLEADEKTLRADKKAAKAAATPAPK